VKDYKGKLVNQKNKSQSTNNNYPENLAVFVSVFGKADYSKNNLGLFDSSLYHVVVCLGCVITSCVSDFSPLKWTWL
jgi:hypothetical protein